MTAKVTLREDQLESLRKLVRHYSGEGLQRAVSLVTAELESSVRANSFYVEQFPENEDLKKSLAINEAYLEFISTAPVSFFK